MLKTFALLSILLALIGCTRTPRVPADWAGDYTYDADLGRNAADTGMVVTYDLHLHGTTCTLTADGYQTDESLLCAVAPHGASLDILFHSFADGATKNNRGNEPYHRGQTLFSLTHSAHGRILTRWSAYTPASNNDTPPRPSLYFHRTKAPATPG